ncbi:hypothetical protein TNIN_425271 [Trichonephila inaurata madagascariensis]|uniref:Uncharacterized protein n=1 Tax=Trichonephila inaurata madagascariensis TaxID=2747483 RepID=A0A8X6XHR5_9ARAC|nr:hypothetical protein TNIN_425271 [Trichonephila inaurata madagascariensis]
MFNNCRKEDLRIVALELGETVAEKVTIDELTEIIKENKYFKENVEFVKELIQYTIEDRKKAEEDRKRAEEDRKRVEEDRKKEAENRLREKELELARLHVGVNSDNERTGERVSIISNTMPLATGKLSSTCLILIKYEPWANKFLQPARNIEYYGTLRNREYNSSVESVLFVT